MPKRTKVFTVAGFVLLFLCGLAVGVLVATAAARRSVQAALGAAQLLLEHDQERMLATAWNAGDMDSALAHATCAFDIRFSDAGRYFDPVALDWSLWGGALAQTIIVEPNAKNMRQARPTEQAGSRARVAVVLERLGKTREAQEQLQQAAMESGVMDAEGWRKLGLRTVGWTLPAASVNSPGKPK